MPNYKVGIGHDLTLVDMVDIVPQPRTETTTAPVQRNDTISGVVHEQGLWIPLQWSMLDPASQYQALLEQFGLDTDLSCDVTVYVPNFEYVFTLYNGKAIRPEQGVDIRRTDQFIRDVTIRIIQLEAI